MNRRSISHLILSLAVALSIALAASGQSLGQGSDRVVKAKGYASASAVRPGDKLKVAVALEVEDGYHINAHVPTLDFLIPTSVTFEPASGLKITEPRYPAPSKRKFEFAPDTDLAVHEGTVYITADVEADGSLPPGESAIRARVEVQSCNDKQCLAPSNIDVEIPIRVVAAAAPVKQINSELFARAAAVPAEAVSSNPATGSALTEFKGGAEEKNAISDLISSRGIFFALVSVFISGLLLNATPCVYPIIPITIGFFVNQSAGEGSPRLRRTFLMASTYVLGMAITYSILGVIASMTKGLFGAALQNPIVLVALALLMIGLALSMFGVYEFRLPESLNQFANKSAQSTSGIIGALVMGLTMGIVAAPCIGPFVLGLLVHVGTKGDPVYGFFMFFVLALGLGLPYLVLGTFSGALKSLPRSGLWMVTVRKVFGLVLVGMALYFLMPLMGGISRYVFILFFIAAAFYLIFWEAGRTKPAQFAWVLRAIGAAAAVVAVLLALPRNVESGIEWQPYSEQTLAAAARQGKGVIIDTYADWCIPCKELDQLTFTNANVKREAERFVTLKLDLTSSDPQSEAGRARERFGIRGVPTIIFLDAAGREQQSLRLEGFEKPDAFLSRMKQVSSTPGAPSQTLAQNTADGKSEASDAATGAASASSAEPLPAASLNLIDGGTLNLQSLAGKVVVVDFWATWCVPCLSEIPMFNQLGRDYKARGLEIVAISLDEEGAQKVKPFLKAHPMDYTQVIGDAGVAAAFNVADSSLPVTLVVDKQGRIRFRHVGLTKKEALESEIKQLLGE
jgi:thiol:disulfide interchange protein DsbD